MRLTVNNTTNPLNQLMGLYPARGLHTFDNGAAVGWDYALTDKPGARGVLQAVGIGVLDAAANGMAGCADAIVAGVDGRVHSNEPGDPSAGFALNAEFAVDRGLYCMAASGDDIVFANIGLTLRGVVSGDKL
jgi:hypothetical protein